MIIKNALISQWLHTIAFMITWQKKKCGNWKDDDLWPPFCTSTTGGQMYQALSISLPFSLVVFAAHWKGDNACTVTANVIISCGVWWPWLEKCCFLKNKQSFKLLMHLFNLFPSLFLFLKSGRKICTYFEKKDEDLLGSFRREALFLLQQHRILFLIPHIFLQNLTSIDLM